MGSERFAEPSVSALINRSLSCIGTENHLSDCTGQLSPPNASVVSGCADVLRSAFIVCQGNFRHMHVYIELSLFVA